MVKTATNQNGDTK